MTAYYTFYKIWTRLNSVASLSLTFLEIQQSSPNTQDLPFNSWPENILATCQRSLSLLTVSPESPLLTWVQVVAVLGHHWVLLVRLLKRSGEYTRVHHTPPLHLCAFEIFHCEFKNRICCIYRPFLSTTAKCTFFSNAHRVLSIK